MGTRELTQALFQLCHRVGEELGAHYLEQRFGTPLEIETKVDDSPVTIADQHAHEMLAEGLARLCPGVPIVSEEGAMPRPEVRAAWPEHWLVDPLDGTREFIDGSGQFCVNIALMQGMRPYLGVIYLPLAGHMYIGGVDHAPVCVSKAGQRPLAGAAVSEQGRLNTLYSRRGIRHRRAQALQACLGGHFDWVVHEIRGSAWKFCRLAEGGAHLYPRFGPTSEWDTAAGQALLDATGGAVLVADGSPLRYGRGDTLLNPPFIGVSDANYDWAGLLAEADWPLV